MVGEITENNMSDGTLSADQFSQQQLSRQQKMAEMLLQQGLQQPQGQMVSGHYVAPSLTQNLAGLANIYMGQRGIEKAEKAQLDLADRLRKQTMQDVQAYGQAARGTPEQTVYGAGMEGPTMDVTPAVAPNPERALGILMGSRSPQSQALAQALLADQMKTIVAPEGSTIYRGGIGGAGETIQGTPKVGQDLKDAAREAKLDINNINNWSPQDWTKVRTIEANTANLKRPTNVVNIPNFTEKTFAGGLAEKQVAKFDTLQTMAEKAPDVLRTVAESRKILDSGKFFSGSPANLQLEMAKFADAFGLGGKETKDKAANTQTLITNAAGATLDSIAGSGLGAGQGFTDKDLRFLQEAKSFRIDMTDANIRRVIDLQEKAAKASVGRYNDRLKTLPQSSIQQMGLKEIVLPRTAEEIVKDK